jgi:hypothetical protein
MAASLPPYHFWISPSQSTTETISVHAIGVLARTHTHQRYAASPARSPPLVLRWNPRLFVDRGSRHNNRYMAYCYRGIWFLFRINLAANGISRLSLPTSHIKSSQPMDRVPSNMFRISTGSS